MYRAETVTPHLPVLAVAAHVAAVPQRTPVHLESEAMFHPAGMPSVAALSGPTSTSRLSTQAGSGHGALSDSYTIAEQLLTAAQISKSARAGRLFVPLLTSNHHRVCNMLKLFQDNIAKYNNTADIFIFSLDNAANETVQRTCPDVQLFNSTVHFMALSEHWSKPKGSAADTKLWSGLGASLGYRQMGNWRLLFPFQLAHHLGYQYAWQLVRRCCCGANRLFTNGVQQA